MVNIWFIEFRNNRDAIHRNQKSCAVKYIRNTEGQYLSIELQYFSVKGNALNSGLRVFSWSSFYHDKSRSPDAI